jgi:hypothetical protein
VRLQPSLQAVCGLRLLKRCDQVSERAVVDASTMLGCSDDETDRQVRVANTRRPKEDHALAPFDEAELVQTLDLLTSERGLKAEIEVAELLDRGQTARAHPA